MRRCVLVNGVPASGKSTVMAALLPMLGMAGIAAVPLALDTVKEGFFTYLGTGDRDHNRLLGRASYHAIFDSIAGFPDDLVPVVDAWHGFQPIDVLRGHLARARIDRVIEIWCVATPDIVAARYRTRSGARHAGHLPASYGDELHRLAGRARPMAFGPVLTVETEVEVGPEAFDMLPRLLTTTS